MILVTGATGHLGRLVVQGLLEKLPAQQVAVAVRDPHKAADLAALGVQVRRTDYNQPETVRAALAGVDKVLLVSSNAMGERLRQHGTVVDAAREAGVKLLAYTSILRADTSGLALAQEHLGTERLIRDSGVPFVFLRNGWYLENYTGSLAPAVAHGALVGSSGEGRIAAASRADYAAAAVRVLTTPGHEHQVYELGGDTAFTRAELAAELSRQTGKTIVYQDLPPARYQGVLEGAGLPTPFARILVDSELGAGRGELDDRSGTLARLIGHPTTRLAEGVRAALR